MKPPANRVLDTLALLNRCKVKKTFTWSDTDEPHAIRRRLILADHPEIVELFGPEPFTAVVVVGLVIVQLVLANLSQSQSWPVLFVLGWSVGGLLNHSLQLAAHELSHNLCFDSLTLNKLTAVVCNLPTAVPSAITFARYHMDHHVYQGVDGLDTDVPSHLETLLFRSSLGKLAWVFLQPMFYAFRPVCIKPKELGTWEIINIVVQVTFDALILYFLGVKAFSYLIIGTFLGLGLHPAAGHFIAEHYEFVSGVETYSYYGFWNIVNFNVGYHNEHHDFPRVPWTRLPKLKKIAAEYYDSLPQHTSYVMLLITYILDDSLGQRKLCI
jgi:sphingolipid delta-4 desaturase